MFVALAPLPFSKFYHSISCLEVAHGLLFLVRSSCRQLCRTSKYHTVSLSSGLLTDNADNDLNEHREEEGIFEPFLSKSSRSSVMDANIADSLDKEDSLSNQEQGHTATSISEAYGLHTASVKGVLLLSFSCQDHQRSWMVT